jgi:carbon-monoxide dehydrogenase small subunit
MAPAVAKDGQTAKGARLDAARRERSGGGKTGWGMLMAQVTMNVNGRAVAEDIEPRMLLVEFLRERLGLTGTHVGCDTSQCGACVVSVDGKSLKSCAVFAVQLDGAKVTTIEGLAGADGTLHPMQAMFREHHALQCGFCTPGMVMSAIDLVKMHPQGMTEEEIRHGLEGNLCRCTGYHNIVKAIDAAQRLMHPMAQAAE